MKKIITTPILNPFQRKGLVSIILTALFLLPFGKAGMGYAQIITTYAGNGTIGSSGDGSLAINAELHTPSGVAIDAAGNLYIADAANNKIRMVTTAGVITTIAGTGTAGFSGDGGAATAAQLNTPTGVTFAGTNLVIADAGNNRIRMISYGTISTVIGTGTAGFSGDGGTMTAAELNHPTGVAIDGNYIYIADYGNNRIRVVNASYIISTLAGNSTAGYSGDGGSSVAAELNGPNGVSVDAAGNVYVADKANNRIRMINSSGIITTVAGDGTFGYSGDGGAGTAAKLAYPEGVTCDVFGNFYIVDNYYPRIRKVNNAGIISTIAGSGVASYSGDGGAATAARISNPSNVAFDGSGNMYIADGGNNRVRMVTNVAVPAGINQLSVNSEQLIVYPNPSNGVFNLTISEFDNLKMYTIEINDLLGNATHHQILKSSNSQIDVSNLSEGVYFVTVTTDKATSTKKILVTK
ncbi:MAG: NHL domain-containing protein [Bacteroidia bacterium]